MLPLLAVHATWVAVQNNQQDRFLSVDELVGNKSSQPMSKMEMISNLMIAHEAAMKRKGS